MKIKDYNTDREKPAMRKRLQTAVFVTLIIVIVLTVFRYFRFVTEIIYEESVSHLTEIFRQSDKMLTELINKNMTYLHMWSEYLRDTSGESEIRDYIENAQEDAGFLEFCFLSADGNYKMITGETGYLGLQDNMEDDGFCTAHPIIEKSPQVAAAKAMNRLFWSKKSFFMAVNLKD